jgi:hypothetical protein
MRLTRTLTLIALITFLGCRNAYVAPEAPLPPNTILLSQMMRELSAHPGFTEALLKQLDQGNKKGAALMTPALIDELRKRILGKDWQGLDRFPGWTMSEINPTVRVAGHFAGKDEKLEATASVHPGTSPSAAQVGQYLDLGPYVLDKAETVSLDKPSTLTGFATEGIVSQLGDGVTRGDGPNDLAPEHAESQRLADMLNRLAVNKLEGSQRFEIGTPFLSMIHRGLPLPAHTGLPVVYKMIAAYSSPEDFTAALQSTGHTITVDDARYFANFGHLHYGARGSSGSAQDVMMPFWVNTHLLVPNSGSLFHLPRPLLIPVSHAEYEWHIRGPLINADISYYFGIDGKSEWRTMDTLDQAWVLKRNAHEYTGAQAVEVTRLASALTVAYMHQHERRPNLPFGGYYALGVCQDTVSAIERRMTGHVTLFPNTVDATLFDDPRDPEVNDMLANIPKDRSGTTPSPARIFGSLPVAPAADPAQAFNAITIPGLAADLNATYAEYVARPNGQTGTSRGKKGTPLQIALDLLALVAFSALLVRRLYTRRKQRNAAEPPPT